MTNRCFSEPRPQGSDHGPAGPPKVMKTPGGTPLKTLFQIIDSTRSACGAGTLACWVETHLDRTSSGLKAPTRVSAQQTESPRHLASSSTLVGRRPMVTPSRSRLGLAAWRRSDLEIYSRKEFAKLGERAGTLRANGIEDNPARNHQLDLGPGSGLAGEC